MMMIALALPVGTSRAATVTAWPPECRTLGESWVAEQTVPGVSAAAADRTDLLGEGRWHGTLGKKMGGTRRD